MTRPRKHPQPTRPPTETTPDRAPSPSNEPRSAEHAPLLDEQRAASHGHDDRPTASREDDLLGTSSSHTPPPDSRNEEPSGLGDEPVD